MHMEEQCCGVSGDGRERSMGPNIKRIIPGTNNQCRDEESRIRNVLECLALRF